MKGKKIAALLLAGCMAVTALSGCGMDKDAIVATMDGQEVTLGVANFLCRYQQAESDDMYSYYAYYYGYDFVWSEDLYSSGSTTQEDLKESVMDELHTLYTLKLHMDDYGVEITEEDEAAIAEAAEAFMESNSEEAIELLGATQEIVEEVLTLYTIQYRMYEEIIKGADTEVSDEEANMRGYTYVSQYLLGYYDDDYNLNEYTEDEQAEFAENFEAMEAAIADGEDYDTVVEEYGYTTSTNTYAADDDSLDEDLIATLDELAEGESAMVTTDYYLYLVRLDSETDEEATEENRQSIIEERQEDYYAEIVEGWQEDDGWTVKAKVLKKIQFENLFTTVSESTETESVEDTEGTEAVETTEGTEAEETTEGTEAVETTEGTETVDGTE